MNCPLCNTPMTLSYRTINRPPENHIPGYTDVLYCTGRHCHCTVDLIVRDHQEMHDIITGKQEHEVMGKDFADFKTVIEPDLIYEGSD